MSLIRCPQKFDPTFINRVFFPEEYESGQLDVINSGRCYDWAYIAHCLWEEVILWSADYHAWVQVEDLHFDSETVEGVLRPRNLRTNRRWGFEDLPPQVMQVEEFKSYWNQYGGGSRFHWGDLLKKIHHNGIFTTRR